ncbi:hypothetical protein B0H65DRAFT_428274 [Neurospora tetraspora]|uniref:Uncharacterized protein n=1 Tax=Neurospora tetraspora TaxID=94610 RepID=A0AAE0MSB1_9PEZI|nr:hypothetical protein B0H65DRAFT_428274 [Neurospora tetraspora]
MSGLRKSGQHGRTARGAQDTPEDVELFKLLFTSTLTATVCIPHAADEMHQRQVIALAEGAQRRVTTPNDLDISLGIFASASCVEGHELKGAYSVVFRQMSPGTSDHGELFKMGWNQPSASDSQAANGLAIAQAISISGARLRTIAAGPQGAVPRKARVQVFTASNPALRHIINQAEIQGPRQALQTRVSSLVHQEVQKLSDIPGMRVELVLYWLPAKCGVTSLNEAHKIAMKCRKDGRNMFFVDGEMEERSSAHMPKSVSSIIADVLIRERLRINKERKTDGKATAATAASMKAAHKTTEPAMDQDVHALSLPTTPYFPIHPPYEELRDSSPPATETGQAAMPSGEETQEDIQAPLDEQALVDRQIVIECYENHIRSCREKAIPGRSTRGTEPIYSGIADTYCDYLGALVPDHPLVQVPDRPTHPLMAALFSP